MSADRARSEFSDVVSRAAFSKERTVVTRNGKKMAAVVPIEDLELLEAILEKVEYRADVREALAALDEVEKEGTIAWDDLKAELQL